MTKKMFAVFGALMMTAALAGACSKSKKPETMPATAPAGGEGGEGGNPCGGGAYGGDAYGAPAEGAANPCGG
jgi:hypothetical protein